MKLPQNYLIVDDDRTNNLICDYTIQSFDKDARIELFLDPHKALTYIAKKYLNGVGSIPTILFLDVNMPTMTGFEFLDEFKKFGEEVQDQFTIYILSSSIEDFKMQATKYPFVAGFLSKPLKVSYLKKIKNT